MAGINAARGWIDDVALAMQRTSEAQGALTRLAGDATAADDVIVAVRSGSTWNNPFDAVRDLADGGNRGLWDAWTKSDAAEEILSRAVEHHHGGDGYLQLVRAREAAAQASGDVGIWIANGGRSSIQALESVVRPQLELVREMAQLAARAG
jgi:hypothetical protein